MWQLTQKTHEPDAQIMTRAENAVVSLFNRKDLGFWQLPQRDSQWSSSLARGRELRETCSRMVVLGMGGSSLGGRALQQALESLESRHQLEFIDNNDGHRFGMRLQKMQDLERTHWVIISKSGNTIETLSMAEFVDQHLRQKGLGGLASRATVVSETTDNPLTRWAKAHGVPGLEIPKDVGGRFSVLTPVGLLPAAFYGVDVNEMRRGAQWALDNRALVRDLTAQTLASFGRDEVVTLFWSYADGLRDFGLWTQQLWAESLGKKKDRKGQPAPRVSTPVPAVGASDQHSILQQVMEGHPDKFMWFLRVKECEQGGAQLEQNLFDGQELMQGKTLGALFGAEAVATERATKEAGVPSLTLMSDSLSPASVGALFMILELVVGSLGEALDINAFDQPGVELGKRLARQILQSQ